MSKTAKLLALLAALIVIAAAVVVPRRAAQALDRTLRGQIIRAVVQLGPVAEVKDKKGKVTIKGFGWGSGTIISPDGYILTNFHVTATDDVQDVPKNVKILEGKLMVFLTKSSDKPPIATYIADVIAGSEELDLAVVKISTELNGQEVNPEDLSLPFIEPGDSDGLELGDTLNIFGYPGIGGETITFTSGPVSGFTGEAGIGDRAWIKTSATIAGGNSGGTAVDEDGLLVGVPTRGGAGGSEPIADCRPVVDSNNDGQIDENDPCIPMGGFINALRPINLGKTLIEEAAQGGSDNPDQPIMPDNPADPVSDGVQVTGVIVDADTGKAINGALFVVLREGVTWDQFDGTENDVLASAQTDRKGYFELEELLPRGSSYSMGAAAKNYQAITEDDIEISDETPAVVKLNLKLQRQ